MDIDEITARLDKKREQSKTQRELRAKYKNMTYAQVLQEPENETRLMRVEATQRSTMQRIMVKDMHPDRKEWKDEFALFWIGFLNGEYKSINEYLKRKTIDS